MKHTRCWLIGAGAVGSVMAGLLHESGKMETTLVGSSSHAQSISDHGLFLEPHDAESTRQELRVVRPGDVPVLGMNDLVLLTGKTYHLKKCAVWLRDICPPEVNIISLQNGLGIRDLLRPILGRDVDRGLIFFGAVSKQPGTVFFYPGSVKLANSDGAHTLREALDNPLLEIQIYDEFTSVLWLKLAFNCVVNPLAGLFGATLMDLGNHTLDPAKSMILEEVRMVAKAENVIMPMDLKMANKWLWSENTPSLSVDLQRGEETEIEFLNGAIIRLAKKHRINVPANEMLVSMIRYLVSRRLSQ